ncbi:transposase domain-containing protein [Ileibacterium valens]|uniref:transposase domain-containing protein n=1 Tax=Ileibacterium valens TaxID=1862668 RepID=UPI00272BC812|nr:transposase domain-containing protein [Ileibacterium valens]
MSAYLTILMTARENCLKPEEYLTWVLHEMKTRRLDEGDLQDLLPYSDKIPEELKVPKNTQ